MHDSDETKVVNWHHKNAKLVYDHYSLIYLLSNKAAMGGYVLRYESNFHFLTIRGSGHMVSAREERRERRSMKRKERH